MKNKKSTYLILVTVLAALLLAACQPAKPAALSNDQVIQVIDNILKSINAGDYQAFTQDFSTDMQSSFTEAQFTSLVDLLKKASGSYVSCAGATPELSNSQDYAVYRQMCNFDLEKVIVTVTFKENGTQVEGLFFDSTNLRKVSQ
jgi:hypothetical protein